MTATMKSSITGILLILLALGVTALMVVVGPPRSWSSPEQLQVDTASLPASPLTPASEVSLAGEGFTPDTRVWLVPETTERVNLLASLQTWGAPYHLVFRNHIAYVANKVSGLLLVDVRNPREPRILGVLDTPGQVMQTIVRDRTAFLADGKGGVRIVDVADPEHPREIGALPVLALRLAVYGNYLYAASGRDGLLVADISDPRRPRQIARVATRSPLLEVAVAGTHLLLGYNRGGDLASLAAPDHPTVLAPLPLADTVRGFAVRGDELFAVTRQYDSVHGGEVLRIDLTGPDRPRLVAQLPLFGYPSDVTCTDDRLVVSLESNGVKIFDASAAQTLRLVDSVEMPDGSRCAVLSEGVLWLASGTGTLQSVELRKSVQHPFIAEIAAPSTKDFLYAAGEFLYQAREREIIIYQRKVPGSPMLRGKCLLAGKATAIVAQGDYLYVSCQLGKPEGRGQVAIIDCRDPDHPRQVDEISVDHPPRNLALDKGILVVSEGMPYYGQEGMPVEGSVKVQLVNVSLPQLPAIIASMEVESLVVGVELKGNVLCLVLTNGMIRLVDVEDPANPVFLGEAELPWLHGSLGYPRADVYVRGRYLMIATTLGGVKIFDIANLRQPVLVGSFDPEGVIKHSVARDEQLFLALAGRGVMLVDVGTPETPRPLGEITLPSGSNCIAVTEQDIWFAPISANGVGIRAVARPVPVAIRPGGDGRTLHLTLPNVAVAGDYALWVQNRKGWVEQPAAIRMALN